MADGPGRARHRRQPGHRAGLRPRLRRRSATGWPSPPARARSRGSSPLKCDVTVQRRGRRCLRRDRAAVGPGRGAGRQRRPHPRRVGVRMKRRRLRGGARHQPGRRPSGSPAGPPGDDAGPPRPPHLPLVRRRACPARPARSTTPPPRPASSGWPARSPASWRRAGITANVVAPGPVSTDMTDALSEARRAEMVAAVPIGRFATPEEIAAAVTFLASRGRLRHRGRAAGRRRTRHGGLVTTTVGRRERHARPIHPEQKRR